MDHTTYHAMPYNELYHALWADFTLYTGGKPRAAWRERDTKGSFEGDGGEGGEGAFPTRRLSKEEFLAQLHIQHDDEEVWCTVDIGRGVVYSRHRKGSKQADT